MPAREKSLTEQPTLLPHQGALAALTGNVFHELGVPASLWLGGPNWRLINSAPNAMDFELSSGSGSVRWTYNKRSVARVLRTGEAHLGRHAGFADLFVPVRDSKQARSVLIVGPIALARPSSADILARWRTITGSHGRLTDGRFSSYVEATLGTLTLESRPLATFRALVQGFADLMTHTGEARRVFAAVERARAELLELRFAERMWEAARSALDERTGDVWLHYSLPTLQRLGLERVPSGAIACLLRSREPERDPVDALIRRDALQRAAVELARKLGGIVCGRIGDRGFSFLVERSRVRSSQRLAEHAGRAVALARRFGFELHAGWFEPSGPAPLHRSYRVALLAAERALIQGVSVARADPRLEPGRQDLYEERSRLESAVRGNPKQLIARFEHYVQVVLVRSGYQLERTRAGLEAGFERLIQPLASVGLLSDKERKEITGSLETRAEEAESVMDLVTSYQSAAVELLGVLESVVTARHERTTRRAVELMQERYAEPLSVSQLARAVGFAPEYFSKLFKRDEGVSPEIYLLRLRQARAMSMLDESALSVDAVAKLCGFQSRSYFHHAFKRAHGMTPGDYRLRASTRKRGASLVRRRGT